ncbi:MAG: 16S rRNA (adenine(1518)-N(6)/adenine(1519)-N(6))-dimethyltransferase RsmA [Bifidobacteriaceae bacterium]|jgi:16S rRNA (adenine1518-N6/adenine1519-N6)-dimethyltransferase|nr:16S rRNA (adenine(1518)-N(6)/adenine(1519)-N(6))-dimethyltransferase RsmA [Bifidobacteriaceae bacterium]
MQKLTQSYISEEAKRLGISPTKKLGQNFMIDEGTAQKIVKLADLKSDSKILEIGPGFGSLTQHLVNESSGYLGIEYDKKLFEWISEKYKNANAHFLHKDAMKLEKNDFQNFEFDSLVANLPYNISTPLLITYFQNFENLKVATVLVQKEVADRILANPGGKHYGIPTAKLKLLTLTKKLLSVPPGVFWPRPKVDSTLIKLVRKDKPLENMQFTFKIIDAAFAHRRKTLASSLAIALKSDSELNIKKENILSALSEIGKESNVRAEELSPGEFDVFAKALLC